MNENEKQTTTTQNAALQATTPAEIHNAEPKKTCKTCLLYQGYKHSCYSDGVNPTDICDRYEPNPVIYL